MNDRISAAPISIGVMFKGRLSQAASRAKKKGAASNSSGPFRNQSNKKQQFISRSSVFTLLHLSDAMSSDLRVTKCDKTRGSLAREARIKMDA